MINPNPPSPVQKQNAQNTILLAEDEVLIRLALADELRLHGYRVIEAANANEALSVIATGDTIDLLITDLQMPGAVSGAELARLVRINRPSMKLIIASAHAPGSQASSAADAVFEKPYDTRTLVARLKALLEQRER